MSLFGWGVGDIIAVSQLAMKVYTVYKDAPDEYRHISEEVRSLQIIIDGAIHYFKGGTLSDNKQREGQEVLQGCQSVLEELESLIEKYQSIASGKKWQFFKKVKFGNYDIMAIRIRLTSNTSLLTNFIRRSVLAFAI